MVNGNKLKGKIVECGLSVSQLAEIIGVDKATLYRKINSDGSNISVNEAVKIARALNLSLKDVNAIFFADFIA
jgi:putative cro-like protein